MDLNSGIRTSIALRCHRAAKRFLSVCFLKNNRIKKRIYIHATIRNIEGNIMLRITKEIILMVLLLIATPTLSGVINMASAQVGFDQYRLLNPYQLRPGESSPIEFYSGDYLVSVHILHGLVDEIVIRLRDEAHGGPSYPLASQFMPTGIDWMQSVRSEKESSDITDTAWWEWDLPLVQKTVRLQEQVYRVNSPSGKFAGDLFEMRWMWKSFGSERWGR